MPEPVGPRVLIKLLDRGDAPSGIIIPEGAAGPDPDRGIIMYVGPGYRSQLGGYTELDYRPGDEVLFFRRAGVEVDVAEERLQLIHDEDVLVILERAVVYDPERTA